MELPMENSRECRQGDSKGCAAGRLVVGLAAETEMLCTVITLP